MTDCDGALAKWASSRFVARWLLCLPDRGCLQTATFHTLRTYLTPINKQVRKWRRSFYAEPVPDVVREAQKWLSQFTEAKSPIMSSSPQH
jgi:hypothetical protein